MLLKTERLDLEVARLKYELRVEKQRASADDELGENFARKKAKAEFQLTEIRIQLALAKLRALGGHFTGGSENLSASSTGPGDSGSTTGGKKLHQEDFPATFQGQSGSDQAPYGASGDRGVLTDSEENEEEEV